MEQSEEIIDVGRGVTLCCERFGEARDPPLLLIAGLGQQLLAWPEQLCLSLSREGFQVIRFDNRDAGRSWHAGFAPPSRGQLITRRLRPEQYDLADMALDTAGLIEALELGPVHVVGMSMGAMIGQTLAARHPQRVRTLVSMLSSTGARRAGQPAPSTLRMMLRRPPRDRETAAGLAVSLWQHIGSHGFPFDEPAVRELAMRAFDRDPGAAAGRARQLAAILKSGDRTPELRRIDAPTLVLHGDRDRMVHPSGGRASAAAIPRARAVTIQGMGHDLPAGAWSRLIELISELAWTQQQAPAR